MKDTRRKILWAFGILAVLCPFSLCGLGYYAFRLYFVGPGETLPHELDLARKAGMPLEPADLRPKQPILDEQNAARIYRAFFPHIERAFKQNRKLRDDCRDVILEKADAAARHRVEEALDQERESLAQVVAAGEKPFCDFLYRYEDGLALPYPEHDPAREVNLLLCTRAHFASQKGNLSQAARDLRASHVLAVNISKDPTLMSLLCSAALDSVAMDELSRVLRWNSDSAAKLDGVERLLESFEGPSDLHAAVGAELVLGRISIRQLQRTTDIEALDGGHPRRRRGFPLPASVKLGLEARYVAAMRSLYSRLPKDPNDSDTLRELVKGLLSHVNADQAPANAVARALLPIWDDIPLMIAKQVANRRIIATSIRLMRMKLKSGEYPATLPDFGKLSIDPMDGKPLRYRRQGSGFMIYSIDSDLEDNGGRPKTNLVTEDLVRSFD